MTIFDDVEAKLVLMEQNCIDQSEVDCDTPAKIAYSISTYQTQFTTLRSAITTYKTTPGTRVSQLTDMIIMDFVNVMLDDLVYVPALYKPTAPFPEGYDDYLDLFSCNGVFADILGYAVDYFYQGCIISPTWGTARLVSHTEFVNSAEAIEAGKRTTLINYLRYYPQLNTLLLLTENFTVSGTSKTKQATSEVIYNTKHAKDIIELYNLDVYIPTYL